MRSPRTPPAPFRSARTGLGGVAFVAAALALAASTLFGSAFSQRTVDAVALLDEASYYVRIAYGGSVPVPTERIGALRAELAARCATLPAPCDVALGREAVAALTAELDAHTGYLDPAAFASLRDQLRGGSVAGFGFELAVHPAAPGLVVTDLVPGGAAERAGIARGDRILAVDGVWLPARATERRQAIRSAGRDGRLELTGVRGAAGAAQRVVTAVVDADPDGAMEPWLEPLAGTAARLRVPSYLPAQRVADAVHDLVARAGRDGVEALIVDLRGNPGGVVAACVAASGAFVDEPGRRLDTRTVDRTLRYRAGAVESRLGPDSDAVPSVQLRVERPARFGGRLAVLIDDGTASCAEFMALDLAPRAVVVGATSAGLADTAVSPIGLSDGSGLLLTTARVHSLGGAPYPSAVSPDIWAQTEPDDLTEGRDVALDVALDALGRP